MTLDTRGLYLLGGTIWDGETNVRKAAAVRLTSPTDASFVREIDAGSDGNFLFKYVPAGSYEISVEGKGLPAQQRTSLQNSNQAVAG